MQRMTGFTPAKRRVVMAVPVLVLLVVFMPQGLSGAVALGGVERYAARTVQALTETRDGYLWVGTLDGLARRGVHFAICGISTRGMASMFAGKGAGPSDIEAVMDELVKSMPANAHVMASGILAAQRAGEYGYTVLGA